MPELLFLTFTGLMLLSMLLFVGGLFYWFFRLESKRRKAWESNARHWGFSFHAGPHSQRPIHARRVRPEMHGQYDGQSVYVGIRSYSTGSGKNQSTHYFTYVDVPFNMPLKRRLHVRRSNGLSIIFGDFFGQRDIQVGHEHLDREFRIDGEDPDQVRALVGHPQVVAALLAHPHGFSASLRDDRVRFEQRGQITNRIALEAAIIQTVHLYRTVYNVWKALPSSSMESRITTTWTALAQDLGLVFYPRAMAIAGTYEKLQFHAEIIPHGKGWATVLRVGFDPPLELDLDIKPAGMMNGLSNLFGSQDIKVGHPEFDSAYVIRGRDEEGIRVALPTNACDALLALHRSTKGFSLNDFRLRVQLPKVLERHEEITPVARQLVQTAKQVLAHRIPQGRGPYRGA